MPLPKFDDEFEFPDEKEGKTKLKAKEPEGVEDGGLAVEVEDDTPPEDRGRKPMKEPVEDPTEDELASYDEKVQQRIKKFTRGYHDERRAKETALREREAAEAFARQILEENKKLQKQLASGSHVLIEQSKVAAESSLEVAKKKYKEAYEAADTDAIIAAQEEIAKATWRMEQAQQMKPIEEKEFSATTAPVNDAGTLSPRTQRWIDNNKGWFGQRGYEDMTMMAMGLDKKLQQQYGPDYVGSEEYFRTIDKTMRKRFPEAFEELGSDEDELDPPLQKGSEPANEEDEPPRRASKPAAVVAPATRSTPPSRIRLKASEAAIARRLGVPLEEYARQVAQLKRGE